MPVRSRRTLLTVLVLVSIVLVTVDYRAGDGGPVAAVRRGVGSVFVPLQEGLATVVRPVGNLFSSIGDFGDLRSENAQLARELEEARLQSRVQEDLERRLEEAEGQLGLREELGKRTVGARVIAEPPSDFEWTLLVNAGADEGVTEGMAVLNADGLVGKVIEVDARTARVELATSPEAGYAVRVADTGEQGLLSGRGAQPLALEPRDPDAVFEPASEVVTQSFVGSSIPDGIPIGRVADTEGGASAGVRLRAVLPYVDFTRLVQVQIVLGEEEPEPETIPSDQAAPTPDSG